MDIQEIIDQIGIEPYHQEEAGVIYNCDCRSILSKMPKVDLVLTDPPYGVNYSTWDKSVPQPPEWLYKAIAISETVYVTPGNANLMLYPQPAWIMAWFRPGSTQRCRNGGFSHWEPILVYGNHRAKTDAKQIKAIPQPDAKGHPCPKPIELFKWLIHSIECNIILDPFLGSGTTALAAKELGRKFIGVEISETYCQIAVKRLRQGVLDFG